MEEQTSEQIAQHYKAMGDSVSLINAIIAGDGNIAEEDKHDCVDRNVRHLEIMRAKDFWTTESFTDVDKAIVDGTNYLSNH
jgi:hypothetical protein